MACFCTRCGEELTSPKFHNGRPYGFVCYEKVAGKKSSDKRQFVQVELVSELPAIRGPVKVSYNNRTYNLGLCLRDTEGRLHSNLAEFGVDGDIFMVTHDRNGNQIWKNL